MRNSKKRTVLVTGASQGIGEAIALTLADGGFNVIAAARSIEKLNALAHQTGGAGEQVLPLALDLSNAEAIDAAIADIKSSHPKLDALINCAGLYSRGKWIESTTEELDELYQVNVRGTFHLTRGLLPLVASAQGDVVFVNSSIVRSDGFGAGHFAATQHAMKAHADSLRAEVNAKGVRVLSVFPGRTATPRQELIHSSEQKRYAPARLLQPQDIANIVRSCITLPDTAEVTEIHIRPKQKS